MCKRSKSDSDNKSGTHGESLGVPPGLNDS